MSNLPFAEAVASPWSMHIYGLPHSVVAARVIVMNHPVSSLVVMLLASVGGWHFYQNYQIDGLQAVRLLPRGAPSSIGPNNYGAWDPASTRLISTENRDSLLMPGGPPGVGFPTDGPINPDAPILKPIQVASFNLQGFGREKASKDAALDKIARLCRNFEVVALQGIIGPDRDLMPRLVYAINQTGARYDYLETFDGPEMRLAIVFDTQRLETDRRQMYRVADPENKLTVDPLVGWFRVSGVPVNVAWTFSLVNVWIDPTRVATEVPIVPQVIRAVQADGRGEDDVIVAGALASDVTAIQRMVYGVQYKPAAVGASTDIYNRTAFDHILVPIRDRSEFTGRAGAIDFLRVMNLTLGEAEEVSDRLPVWAEFIATEGM
jgi:deoxyribonuclease-1-like protein